MADTHWNEPLLLATAVLQVESRLLEEQAGILTDLSDIRTYREIKNELADYIDTHAKAGRIPPSPLTVVVSRLEGLTNFFGLAAAARNRIKHKFAKFFDVNVAVTLAQLQSALAQISEEEERFLPRIQQISQLLSPLDWQGSQTDADIHPELLVCDQLLGKALPPAASDRCKYHRMALHPVPFVAELAVEVRQVRDQLAQKLSHHSTLGEALDSIRLQIENKNHVTALQLWLSAEKSIASFGSYQDLDHQTIKTELEDLQETVREAMACSDAVARSCKPLINHFATFATTKQRSYKLLVAKKQLEAYRSELEFHWEEITDFTGSEMDQVVRPQLEASFKWLDWATLELDTVSVLGQKKCQEALLIKVAACVIAIFLIIGGILGYTKHTAREAATQAAAAAKATIDAEEQARLAEEEAINEAKTKLELQEKK